MSKDAQNAAGRDAGEPNALHKPVNVVNVAYKLLERAASGRSQRPPVRSPSPLAGESSAVASQPASRRSDDELDEKSGDQGAVLLERAASPGVDAWERRQKTQAEMNAQAKEAEARKLANIRKFKEEEVARRRQLKAVERANREGFGAAVPTKTDRVLASSASNPFLPSASDRQLYAGRRASGARLTRAASSSLLSRPGLGTLGAISEEAGQGQMPSRREQLLAMRRSQSVGLPSVSEATEQNDDVQKPLSRSEQLRAMRAKSAANAGKLPDFG